LLDGGGLDFHENLDEDALKHKFTRRELRHRHGHASPPSAWAFRAMKRLSIGTVQLHFPPPVLPEQIFG
jgi:hypothetical protein